MYHDSDNLVNLQKTVDRELKKKIKKWIGVNILALNMTKANYVIFYFSAKMIDQFIKIKLGSKIHRSRQLSQVSWIIV